jgi:flotillin
MQKMNEAAVLEMYFNVLPSIVESAARPLENVDRITMYGDANSSKVVKGVMDVLPQVNDMMKEFSGIDLSDLLSRFAKGKTEDSEE